MDAKYIRPIPNYIAKIIKKKDADNTYGGVNFYAYFSKMKGELVKITVACKHYKKQWFCKQVAVHGIHSNECLVRDMEYTIMGYSVGWYDMALSDRRKNYEDGKWYKADDKYYNPVAGIVNKRYALKFDEYKYSAIDKYTYCDILKYLRVYEQYPQAEYFVKIGLQHLATNKTLLKKAGKDKAFRKWLIQNMRYLRNEYGTYPYFSGQAILLAYKQNLPIFDCMETYVAYRELLNDSAYKNTISHVIPKSEAVTLLHYIKKQGTNLSTYADYIKACEYLGLNTKLPKNRFPHDFKHWHDIRTDQYATKKAEEDKEKRKELYAKFAAVAEKYLALQGVNNKEYAVFIARSPADLIREGESLHHCVGRMNYDQRFVREESLIFFVRHVAEPDTPFVTVEYSLSQKKVLQCYGDTDTKPDDSVLHYVNKVWLPHANRQLKKLKAAA